MHQTPSIPHPKKVFSKVARLFASLRIAIFQEECASLPRLLFAYKTGFCSVQVHKIILHPVYDFGFFRALNLDKIGGHLNFAYYFSPF